MKVLVVVGKMVLVVEVVVAVLVEVDGGVAWDEGNFSCGG